MPCLVFSSTCYVRLPRQISLSVPLAVWQAVLWRLSCQWDAWRHLSLSPQMKCMSCYQSCQRVLPTRAPSVPNAIRPSGGRRWRESFRDAFAMFSLRCSTHAHPHTCYATNRLDTHSPASVVPVQKAVFDLLARFICLPCRVLYSC